MPATPSIQFSWDGPGGTPARGEVLYYNGSKWAALSPGTSGQALLSGGAGADPSWGSAGVTDHGALTGLSDDDHTQYLLVDGSRAMTGQLVGVAGSAAAPSFALAGYPNAGMYLANPNVVGIATGGTSVAIFNNARLQIAWGRDLTLAGGSIDATENDATATMLTLDHAAGATGNLILGSKAGDTRFQVRHDGSIHSKGGLYFDHTVPEIKLSSGGTLSIHDGASADLMRLVHGSGGVLSGAGTDVLTWDASGLTVNSGVLTLPGGSAAAPSLAVGASNRGIYQHGGVAVGIATAGATRAYFWAGEIALQAPVNVYSGNDLSLLGGELSITEDTAANTPLTVKGASGQVADLTQWQNSSSTVLAYVNPAGLLFADGWRFRQDSGLTGFWREGAHRIGLRVSNNRAIEAWYDSATKIGFFNATPVAQPTVTGSRGGNAALASLLTELANLGLITDSSS